MRLPPLALAAAAGLHLFVGAAVLATWQVSPTDETPLPVEIAVVMPAPPQPEAPGEQANEQTAEQPPETRPETQPETAVTAVAASVEPAPEAAREPPPPPITFDPSMIPAPEPPPPVVLQPPVAKPKPLPPAPPRPAPPPVARPVPPSSPPGDAAATTPAPPAAPPSLAVPRPDPSYLDRLAAAVERERDYPTLARRQGHQGRVVVHLVVAASGRLLAARVATGSGLDTLDQAALGMVRRARLPPLGPGFGAESASFTIPIVFAIR